jgi:hypothetical protein
MSEKFRRFVVKWLPAVSGPVGATKIADIIVERLKYQEDALKLFRSMARPLPPRHANAALLHPERTIVSFDHRDELEEELLTWCRERGRNTLSWKLVTGPAGRGKTRLLMHIVDRLKQDDGGGWTAGFINIPVLRENPEYALLFAAVPGDLVFVVDYAERFRNELTSLMQATLALAEYEPKRRIKLLLISRTYADIWSDIANDSLEVGEFMDAGGFTSQEIPSIADSDEFRRKVFDNAIEGFVAHFKQAGRETVPPDDIVRPELDALDSQVKCNT